MSSSLPADSNNLSFPSPTRSITSCNTLISSFLVSKRDDREVLEVEDDAVVTIDGSGRNVVLLRDDGDNMLLLLLL